MTLKYSCSLWIWHRKPVSALNLPTVWSPWGSPAWLGVKRWLLCLQGTSRREKCHRQSAVGNWLIVYSKAGWMMVDLYRWTRDVTAGATGATAVAPKFSDVLTLFQPGGADSAPPLKRSHHKFPHGYVSGSNKLEQLDFKLEKIIGI